MAHRTTDWAQQVAERVAAEPGWRIGEQKDGVVGYAPDGTTIVRIVDSPKDFRWRRNTLSELRKAGLDLYAEFKSNSTRPKRERRAEQVKKAAAHTPKKRASHTPQQMPVTGELPYAAQEWTLSTHAMEQANARNIDLLEVWYTVAEPTTTRETDNDSGRWLYQRGDLALVVAPEAKRVITVLPPKGRRTDAAVARAVKAAEAGSPVLASVVSPAPKDEPSGEWTKAEVAAFAKGLTDAYLQCRELGHNWRPWQAYWDDQERVYQRALKCSRCRTQRWQTLSRFGAVQSSAYVHPEGYLHQGKGRITGEGRDTLRLESVTRAIGGTSGRKVG